MTRDFRRRMSPRPRHRRRKPDPDKAKPDKAPSDKASPDKDRPSRSGRCTRVHARPQSKAEKAKPDARKLAAQKASQN